MPDSCDVVHMHPRLVNRRSTSAGTEYGGRSNEEEVRLDDTARPVRHHLAQPLVGILDGDIALAMSWNSDNYAYFVE